MISIKNNFTYMSAPIEDISDNAFRTLCYNHGADLTFTEMVRVEGLAKKNKATWSRFQFEDNTPTVIQLIGNNEERLKRFLSMFEPQKCFEGFNLNLGCPSPHVISNGEGSALIKRISKTKKLVEIIKKRGYPVNIKIRLGLNKFEKEKKIYLNLINAVNADYFIVHARYAAQTYAHPADYSIFPECVDTGKVIIANGDINTKEKVSELKKMGVKGVMVGRFAVRTPDIFDQLKGKSAIDKVKLKTEYMDLVNKFNPPFRYQKRFLSIFEKKDRFFE